VRLLLVPGAGHRPWLDRPEPFFAAVDTFLRGRWPHGPNGRLKISGTGRYGTQVVRAQARGPAADPHVVNGHKPISTDQAYGRPDSHHLPA
jgi:hypothetical protein